MVESTTRVSPVTMRDMSSDVMPDQRVRHAVQHPAVGSGRVAAQVSLALAWLVMLGVTALWVSGGGIQEAASSATGFFTSLGQRLKQRGQHRVVPRPDPRSTTR